MLEETETPNTPAGKQILERDRKHSGSHALLAIAAISLLVTLLLASSIDDPMPLLWLNVVAWFGLYAYSFSDPIAATGIGIVLAVVGVAINQAAGLPNHGLNMFWLALLASSHAGHRRRARTGTGRRFQVRAFCEAEMATKLRHQELRGLMEHALGSNSSVVARHDHGVLWRPSVVWQQGYQDVLASLAWRDGLTSVAVRCFVRRAVAPQAEKYAMTLVQDLVHAAIQVPEVPASPAARENHVQHKTQAEASTGQASSREPGPAESASTELVPATAAADKILDSDGKPNPTRAWLWTLVTLLVAIKLGVEATLLWAPNLGIAVSPSLLGEIALFPHIYGFSFLPMFYGSGIPGPGFVILLLAGSRCRQHWLEHIQKQAIRSRRFALYLRSFCDDPEKPDAWQFAVNQLSLALGSRNNSSLAYGASVEMQLVQAMLRVGIGTLAIRSPADEGLRLGAVRVALPHDTWESRVHGLMERATLIVLRLRATQGTQRELRTLLASPARARSLILFEKGTLPALVAAAKTNSIPIHRPTELDDAKAGVFVPATGELRPILFQGNAHRQGMQAAAEARRWAASRLQSARPRRSLGLRFSALVLALPLVLPVLLLLTYPLGLLSHPEVTKVTVDELLDRRHGDSWAFHLGRNAWDLPTEERCFVDSVPYAPTARAVYYRAPIARSNLHLVVKTILPSYGDQITGSPTSVALRHTWCFEGVPPHVRRELGIREGDEAVLVEAVNIDNAIANARMSVTIASWVLGILTAGGLIAWCAIRLRHRSSSRSPT